MPGGDAEGRKAYAAQVVEDWNLGGEGGNGLLLVLSISDEDYWVAPTDNFQSGFTLSVLKSLMSENLETDFTNKAYDAAVTNFVTAASEKAEGFVRAQQLAAGASASPEADASGTESKAEGEKGGNVFFPSSRAPASCCSWCSGSVFCWLSWRTSTGAACASAWRRAADAASAAARPGPPAARRSAEAAARRPRVPAPRAA